MASIWRGSLVVLNVVKTGALRRAEQVCPPHNPPPTVCCSGSQNFLLIVLTGLGEPDKTLTESGSRTLSQGEGWEQQLLLSMFAFSICKLWLRPRSVLQVQCQVTEQPGSQWTWLRGASLCHSSDLS